MIKNSIFTISIVFFIIDYAHAAEKEKFPKPINSLEYKCENGQKLNVIYLPVKKDTPHIQIAFKDIKYDLKRVHSASGEKYSNGKQTWWAKGFSGFFQVNNVITIKNCNTQIKKPYIKEKI